MSKPKWTQASTIKGGQTQASTIKGGQTQASTIKGGQTEAVTGEERAVAVRETADGELEVVKVARGLEAQKMIKLAQKQGISVQSDAEKAAELAASHPGSDLPDELYLVMSTVLGFCQELDSEYEKSAAKDSSTAESVGKSLSDFGTEAIESTGWDL